MRRSSVRLVSIACVAACGLAATAHANLVVNGGFETGDFSGWTVTTAPAGSNLNVYAGQAFDGNFAASFAANGGLYDGIAQSLATTAGQEYEITFWVNNLGIENDSLLIDWEGATVLNLTPLGTGLESWEQITLTVLATQNGSSFGIRGFDAQSGIGLDAVSVVAVPAPGAAILLVGAVGRRRRR